jgi:hypothetical protein
MVLGQIPVVSNVLLVIMNISDFIQFYKTGNNSGWAGFIAYAKERSGNPNRSRE